MSQEHFFLESMPAVFTSPKSAVIPHNSIDKKKKRLKYIKIYNQQMKNCLKSRPTLSQINFTGFIMSIK